MTRLARPLVPALLLGIALALLSPAGPAAEAAGGGEKAGVAAGDEGDDLDVTSQAVADTTAALATSQEDLARAQDDLQQTVAQRVAAQALDAQLQAQLDAAEAQVAVAEADLAGSDRSLADQNLELRRLVVASYQQGNPELRGLSQVLTSTNPALLTGQLRGVDAVLEHEIGLADRARAANVILLVKQRTVRAARDELARRREEAADNLRIMQALELQATRDADNVQAMVELRQQAVAAAAAAQTEQLAQIERQEEELARVVSFVATAASHTGTGYSGPLPANHWLAWPVAAPITSPFGWRMHPILGKLALHDGIDLGAACKTPVRAAQAGTVIQTVRSETGYGNHVVLDNGVQYGVGVATTYNHLYGFALVGTGRDQHEIRTGDVVRQGDVIGFVGTTGQSTGCHLHFMVLENGTPVDPVTWL